MDGRQITALGIGLTAAIRAGIILLFPANLARWTKVFNFRGAVAQASEAAPHKSVAVGLIIAGLCVEIFMFARRNRNRRSSQRLRRGRVLRRHGVALEAILKARRFLGRRAPVKDARCFGTF